MNEETDNEVNYNFSASPVLYPPLVIDRERFAQAYNIDVSDFVERHKFKESNQKGKEINFLSYSKAVELFRTHFPELQFDCITNPLTGGYVFQDLNNSGYFIKSYIHDGTRRSNLIYFACLDVSGQAIYPSSLMPKEMKKSLEDRDTTALQANVQQFNKDYYRAVTKAIALVTGIGLKLWTGEDLSEDTMSQKVELIESIKKLYLFVVDLPGYDTLDTNEIPNTFPDFSIITPTGDIMKFGKKLKDIKVQLTTKKN